MSFFKKVYVKSRLMWHEDLYDSYVEKSIKETQTSFLQNQALLNQKINWNNFEQYKFAKEIHSCCPMYDAIGDKYSLIRIGQRDDGGYIMLKPFSREKVAYSIGIADDVSWDLMMAKGGYDVYQYDHTIKGLPIQNDKFHWEQIGLAPKQDKKNKLDTLENLMKKNGHMEKEGMILKMDIEGCEWDILESIDSTIFDKFDQILFELHWIIKKYEKSKVLDGLKKINCTHGMIHVHANNFEPLLYTKDFITPDTFEATFVNRKRYELKLSEVVLPRE